MRSMKKVAIVLSLFVILSFVFVHIVNAVTADQGTDSGLLNVAGLDYVDEKVNELTTQINSVTARVYSANTTIAELRKEIEVLKASNSALTKQLNEVQPESMKFQPVELKAGQQLTAGASAEIVLRSGKAKAVAGTNGGLSDITAASSTDMKTGAAVPLNHLLLVSRDDGRGIKAVTGCWIIIKGTYTIK